MVQSKSTGRDDNHLKEKKRRSTGASNTRKNGNSGDSQEVLGRKTKKTKVRLELATRNAKQDLYDSDDDDLTPPAIPHRSNVQEQEHGTHDEETGGVHECEENIPTDTSGPAALDAWIVTNGGHEKKRNREASSHAELLEANVMPSTKDSSAAMWILGGTVLVATVVTDETTNAGGPACQVVVQRISLILQDAVFHFIPVSG